MMEKLKWIVLIILIIVLFIVVIFNSNDTNKQNILPEKENLVSLQLWTEIKSDDDKKLLINPGKYVLKAKDFQLIEGKGEGLHIEFSDTSKDIKMFFVFDIVDTNSSLINAKFPLFLKSSLAKNNKSSFYRSYIKFGYLRKLSEYNYQEDVIPMANFSSKIDTIWFNDSIGGIKMNFIATHSMLLEEVYNVRYILQGNIDIDSIKYSKRYIQ